MDGNAVMARKSNYKESAPAPRVDKRVPIRKMLEELICDTLPRLEDTIRCLSDQYNGEFPPTLAEPVNSSMDAQVSVESQRIGDMVEYVYLKTRQLREANFEVFKSL